MEPNPPTIRTARIIWFAMLVAVAIYGVVAWIAPTRNLTEAVPLEQRLADPFVLILMVLSVVMFGMSFLMGRLLLARRERPPVLSVWIIQWASLESAAILGLVATFFTGDLRLFLGSAALSVVGFLMTMPSEQKMKDERHPSSLR